MPRDRSDPAWHPVPGAAIPSRVDFPVVTDTDRVDDDDALLVEASMSAESQSQP